MSAPHGDVIVRGYLAQLELELADVPVSRRQEIVGEIRSHIDQARAQMDPESDAEILNLLDRLGEPAEVAASAGLDRPPAEALVVAGRPGLIEIGALVLTPLVWPVGVILLWTSSAWSARDKVIGTLVPPGGYLGVWYALVMTHFALRPLGGCRELADSHNHVYGTSCWGIAAQPVVVQVLAGVGVRVGMVLLLVLPVLVGVYLGTMLRQRARQAAVPA